MASLAPGEKRRSVSASELLASRKGPKSHVPWREAYKDRCRQRLKKRKFEMLFRHGLTEELRTAIQEDGVDLASGPNDSMLSTDGPLQRRSSPFSDDEDSSGTFFQRCASDGDARHRSRSAVDCMDVGMETRHMVCEVMTAEWSAAARDLALPAVPESQLPFMASFNQSQDTPTDANELCSLMEELEEELKQEEAAILERYRERQNTADDDLCSALENLSTEELLCPVCERNYLLQNVSVIFCQCGLRVDTEQDGIDLKFLQKQLQAGTDQHGAACSAKPQFALQSLDGRLDVQNILLLCDDCDFFFIVL